VGAGQALWEMKDENGRKIRGEFWGEAAGFPENYTWVTEEGMGSADSDFTN
jgi:hypothetical protein